jgi:hypothetical protein
MTRKKRSRFAETLVRVRKERGCPSAYGFFHGNGGRRKFGFTYHYYLLIEQGRRLPSAPFLGKILELLGVSGVALHDQRRELLTLYLEELAQGEPLFDVILEPAKKTPVEAAAPSATQTQTQTHAQAHVAPDGPFGPGEELLKTTARRRVSETPHMTPEQYEAANSSAAALWTHQYLLQSGKARTAEQLVQELGIPPRELEFALRVLVESKLVQKKRDSYLCRDFATDLFGPVSGMTTERASWVAEQIQRRIQYRPGEYFYPHFFMVLDDPSKLAMLGRMFSEAMRKAYLVRPSKPVRSGTLVSVEARIGPLASVSPG